VALAAHALLLMKFGYENADRSHQRLQRGCKQTVRRVLIDIQPIPYAYYHSSDREIDTALVEQSAKYEVRHYAHSIALQMSLVM
jgi:hypothetical protein